MKELILIAAVAENRVIGYKGKIPWRIPEDLRHFRSLTLNNSVIMGRNTYESIGKPLEKRKNIVLTRNSGFNPRVVVVCHSLDEAIDGCDSGEVYVIGGQRVYERAISHPLAKRLEIIYIHKKYKGDAFFPIIDSTHWFSRNPVRREGYSFVTYDELPF